MDSKTAFFLCLICLYHQGITKPSDSISALFTDLQRQNDEINLLIFQKNPFPGLLRLFDHRDILVAANANATINNILIACVHTTPMNQPHPYFESINTLGGVEKIFSLFRRNASKHSKDQAAICISLLFRAKEIADVDMRREIIAHLKLLTNDPQDS
ncbi:MAG: hypothetical protein EZS28_053586, partial [Streblomastix strix]